MLLVGSGQTHDHAGVGTKGGQTAVSYTICSSTEVTKSLPSVEIMWQRHREFVTKECSLIQIATKTF